jgi:hypothetical protein
MRKLALFYVVLFTFLQLLNADIPRTLSYQGVLTNNEGVNVPDGDYDINFKLYNVLENGTALWEEQHNDVTVINGVFNVILGSNSTLDLSFDELYWLSIAVEGGLELSPRLKLTASSYSFYSINATNADNFASNPPNHYLGIESINGQVGDINRNVAIEAGDNINIDSINNVVTISGSDGVSQLWSEGIGDDIYRENGNVGIGLTEPMVDLDVAGTIKSLAFEMPTGASNGYVMKSDVLGNATWQPDNVTLPFFSFFNESNTAFNIIHNGNGDLVSLKIQNPLSDGNVLYIENRGVSKAFVLNNNGDDDAIFIDNDVNSLFGININNHGQQSGIFVNQYSDCHAIEVSSDGVYSDVAKFVNSNSSSHADAIYASTAGNGFAGYFNGDIYAENVSRNVNSSIIDHPLDPENKLLCHSSVDSPDMMNIYNGNVFLDHNGEAIIYLPEYFESYNKDFKYQLTCIGGFAQVYIASKIENNSFMIAGGNEGLEVSWQITGVRKDLYAENNRLKAEVEKENLDKGLYLHPEIYGFGNEKSILNKRK